MSTLAQTHVIPPLEHTGRVTQLRVFLSELTKLRSVRSTKWSLAAAFLFTIGVPAIAAAVVSHHWPSASPSDRADFHPLEVSFVGVQIAQLAIGVLGVLVITAEYSTGMIRASMTAVPRRLPVLWGKAVVFGLTTLVADDPGRADRLPRLAVDPLGPSHRHRLHPRGRAASGLRRGALPDRDRPLRARPRRDRAEHRRRDRDVRGADVRAAPADERPAGELELGCLAVPPAPGRRGVARAQSRRTSSRPGPASACSAPMSLRRSRSPPCCSRAATSEPILQEE